MVGKKDTVMIFEKYRNVLAEQQQNNNIQSIINQINTSALAPEVKQGLVSLLKNPEVASKWQSGDADTVNAGDSNFAKELSMVKYGAPDQDLANAPDPNFAKEMAAERAKQQKQYPEQEENEESPVNCATLPTPEERNNCNVRRKQVAINSFSKIQNFFRKQIIFYRKSLIFK